MILSIPRAAFDIAKHIADAQARNRSAELVHSLYQEPLPNAARGRLAVGTYRVFLEASMEELQAMLHSNHGVVLLSDGALTAGLEVRLAQEPKGASRE